MGCLGVADLDIGGIQLNLARQPVNICFGIAATVSDGTKPNLEPDVQQCKIGLSLGGTLDTTDFDLDFGFGTKGFTNWPSSSGFDLTGCCSSI